MCEIYKNMYKICLCLFFYLYWPVYAYYNSGRVHRKLATVVSKGEGTQLGAIPFYT